MKAHAVKRASTARRTRKLEFIWPIATTPRPSRTARSALLAGASFAALTALAMPGAAWAVCNPSTQTISTGVTGRVFSNGGSILVTGGGSITCIIDGSTVINGKTLELDRSTSGSWSCKSGNIDPRYLPPSCTVG